MNTTEQLLHAALFRLRQLDPNGWAMATDGSLDCYTIEEQLEIVEDSIRYIEEENS